MKEFLKRLLGRKKRNKLTLQERFPQYEIGRNSYGDLRVRSWNEGATLRIGAFCSIAAGVQVFLGGEHRTDWVTTYPFPALWLDKAGHIEGHPKTRGNVLIGNDVWIGTDALVMSGVRIGNGAVIGARSVVIRDVPPYTIVAGNPARVVRKRFNDETISRLEAIGWWNWDDLKIGRFMPDLLSDDIEAFLELAERDQRGLNPLPEPEA